MKSRRHVWRGLSAVSVIAGLALSVGAAQAQYAEGGGSASGFQSVAIGAGANASISSSTAIGGGSTSGENATALGHGTTATGMNSIAIGYQNDATGLGSIAIGVGAQATHDHSAAIGGGSVTTRGAQAGYTAPFMTTPQTSDGEVSVGNDSSTGDYDLKRQITNVAAGSAPTDAVNVAQLEGAFNPLRADLTALTGRVDRLEHRIEDVRDIAIAAGALSMAAAQLRFDDRPGKLSVAMGGGAFHGKGAGAIGIGYTSPDRLWRANISGSFTDGEAAFGGGVSFTLN